VDVVKGLADVDIDHYEAAAAKQRDASVRPLCPPSNDRLWIRARGDLPISDAWDFVGSAWDHSPAAPGILHRCLDHRSSPSRCKHGVSFSQLIRSITVGPV